MAEYYFPLSQGAAVTSGFGNRSGGYHWGTDYGRAGGSANNAVYAPQSGTVIYAGAASGFGGPDPAGWVVIDHPTEAGGGVSVLGHVVREVKVGDQVRAGQRVAYVNPNSATNGGVAAHVHLEHHRYVWSQPGADRLDPHTWLTARGAKWPGAASTPAPAPAPAKTSGGVVQMKDWNTLEPAKYTLVGSHRFTRGRARPIDRIVIHHNAANNWSAEQVRDLWNNSREASAHYQVESNGTIAQLVNDSDTAWHAANADINARSIGIEHANISGPPRWQISDATVEAGAHLVAAICRAYKLGPPRWGVNVFPHSQFASTSCPLQLAPGGEDHKTYMDRAAWWYDHPNAAPQQKDWFDMASKQELESVVYECMKVYLGPLIEDTKTIRAQLTGGRDNIPGDVKASFPGWPQLGQNAKGENLTVTDAVAAIRRDLAEIRKAVEK